MDLNLLGYVFVFASLGWVALGVQCIGTDVPWKLVLIVLGFAFLVTVAGVCFIYSSMRDYLNSRNDDGS